jgi:hypothetical protein
MGRSIMRIELSSPAKRRLKEYADRANKTQVGAMSALVEWFASQPDEIKAMVQGDIPQNIKGDVARLILQEYARA